MQSKKVTDAKKSILKLTNISGLFQRWQALSASAFLLSERRTSIKLLLHSLELAEREDRCRGRQRGPTPRLLAPALIKFNNNHGTITHNQDQNKRSHRSFVLKLASADIQKKVRFGIKMAVFCIQVFFKILLKLRYRDLKLYKSKRRCPISNRRRKI